MVFFSGSEILLVLGLPALLILLIVVRPLAAAIQRASEKRLESGAGRQQFGRRVFPAELRYLLKRRKVVASSAPGAVAGKAPSAERNLVGLAISGGGIRSATVGLGVLQALEARGIFRHVDYLSTVSGGGFIGGCLTSFLSGKARKGARLPVSFPFEHRRQEGEEPAVEYLRNHTNYLAPSGGLGWLRMAWAWARGVFLNGLAVLPWMAFAATVLGTLTYEELTEEEVHRPHLTIAVSELEQQLGRAGLALLERELKLQRVALPDPDSHVLFSTRQLEWPVSQDFKNRLLDRIRDAVLAPDAKIVRDIGARIDRLLARATGPDETSDIEDLPAWLERQILPEELPLFYRAAARAAELGGVTIESRDDYFDKALTEKNLKALEERRESDKALLAALLTTRLSSASGPGRYRSLLLDWQELQRVAAAAGETPETLREKLLIQDELDRLAKRQGVEPVELDRLAASAREQNKALHQVAIRTGLDRLELRQIADRLAPFRQELSICATPLDEAPPLLAGLVPGEGPHPFDWRLVDASNTRAVLWVAAPLLLLFSLIYLRHSGAGAPPRWRAFFRVLLGLGILALLAISAIPGSWKQSPKTVLVVGLVASLLAVPLVERILTLSHQRFRRRRRTTLLQRLRHDLRRPDAALLRRRVETGSTLLLVALALALVVDLQKPILDWFHHNPLPWPTNRELAFGLGGLMVVGAILAILPAGHRLAEAGKKAALSLFAFIGLGSMFLLTLWMADRLVYFGARMPLGGLIEEGGGELLGKGILAVSMFFVAGELARLVNANDSSLNGFYRDRLGAAYLVGEDVDGVLGPERDLELQEICPDRSGAPYHLVNTALNLQASTDESLRGRKSGFFVFSRNFIGSSRTGYCSTREIADVYGPVHLGTAMAVSAAAASPNMGTFTLPGLTPLMTLINARLGYWLPHPGRVADYHRRARANRKRSRLSPRRWLASVGGLVRRTRMRPGGNLLWKEIFGRLDERGDAVNVSDGGHLENLGVYELLRRRCKFILVSDAEADPGLHCGSLAALLRYARNDLGIDINIFLDDLTRDERGNTRQHAALGRIFYPPTRTSGEETGYLLYLKSTVTGDEDLVVREYRAKHPSFPHESTADQSFKEDQFEAYRSLGFHSIASVLGDREPLSDFDAFGEWFEELAVKLAPASGAPPLPAEVFEQLQRIDESLERPEMAAYFHEIHPEVPAPAAPAAKQSDGDRAEAERQLVLLVTRQLQLMAAVVETLGLDQHRSQVHPAHRGWMNLFRRWASSPSFKQGYRLLITGFPTRLQFFCDLVLGLRQRLAWQADPADPDRWTLRLEVDGAAGEPPLIGAAWREPGETNGSWEVELQPGFDGPQMKRRARLELGLLLDEADAGLSDRR